MDFSTKMAGSGNNPDPTLILNRIEELCAQGSEVDTFLPCVHDLVSTMQLSVGSLVEPAQTLYRATNHHDAIPHSIDDIWFPPATAVVRLGRCNRVGQSYFYCSSDPRSALQEITPKVGDLVVLSTWQTTRAMTLHGVGYAPAAFEHVATKRLLDQKYLDLRHKLPAVGRDIHDAIARAFVASSSDRYSLTTAIAEVYLRSDDVVGLMYPSVTRSCNADNLALRPEFVRSELTLRAAQAIRVDNLEETPMGGVILADLRAIHEGQLSWVHRDNGTVLVPPNDGVAVKLRPGQRMTLNVDGKREAKSRSWTPVPCSRRLHH